LQPVGSTLTSARTYRFQLHANFNRTRNQSHKPLLRGATVPDIPRGVRKRQRRPVARAGHSKERIKDTTAILINGKLNQPIGTYYHKRHHIFYKVDTPTKIFRPTNEAEIIHPISGDLQSTDCVCV